MAEKKIWDFECPQYYNFTSGLDNSDRDDIFFDCEDPVRNGDVFKNLHTPGNTANIRGLTEDAENKLMDKMTAALSIIENTPKLATIIKKKNIYENVSQKNTCYRTARKDTWRGTVHVPAVKTHRSKSVVTLNRMSEKQNQEKGLRKRSSSLNDLRTHKNKKNTFPMTPMCLKRTIIKSKAKVAAKTTEQMQLEEISRLQKQLIQHLRYNEMSLKKLKLKPREFQNPKNIQAENLKEVKVCERSMNPFLEKLNIAQKETRQNTHKLNHEAVKKQAQKINSIINRGKDKATEREKVSSAWIKTPSVASTSSAVSDTSEKDKISVSKKPTTKKFGFHSGLTFHDNIKKITVVKPFSFDPKIKETVNTVSEQNVNVSLSHSVMDLAVKGDKENIPHCRVRPMFQNRKTDIYKCSGSGKVFQRSMTNQIRGLPLSENINRN